MWVCANGPPDRQIILFHYDACRGGAVPRRLLEGHQGIPLTDGYEPYEAVAKALNLVHAGCLNERCGIEIIRAALRIACVCAQKTISLVAI
jgi:Transposase IS66 family